MAVVSAAAFSRMGAASPLSMASRRSAMAAVTPSAMSADTLSLCSLSDRSAL